MKRKIVRCFTRCYKCCLCRKNIRKDEEQNETEIETGEVNLDLGNIEEEKDSRSGSSDKEESEQVY